MQNSIEQLVRATLATFDSQQFERLGEVLHDDVTLTFLGTPIAGLENVRQTLELLYAAIPDQTHTVERIMVDEPNQAAAVEMVVGGTHDGTPFPTAFGEVPPSGRHVEWRPGSFIRARDEKVATWTVYLDQVEVLRALGVELAPAARV